MPAGPPIVALGELLWDLLPSGPRAGGAPFNFAFHCYQLGHPAVIVSRVGGDDLGRQLREEVRRLGLTDEYIQTDREHPTGTVQVTLDAAGQPAYTITEDVAWDFIEWDERLRSLGESCGVICHGTLARRHLFSRDTIRRFMRSLPNSALKVCDINLRPPFHTTDVIAVAVRSANWLKLNDGEVLDVRYALGNGKVYQDLRGPLPDTDTLLMTTDLDLICVTRGVNGCLVQTSAESIDLPGISVQVADTVGAGDAFTAALLTQHLEGRPLREATRFANAYAAVVASKVGGTPTVTRAEVERLL